MYNQAVIFDLDGTLVDTAHLAPLLATANGSYDEYHEHARAAVPLEDTAASLSEWKYLGFKILIVTARSEKYAASTMTWLAENGIYYDRLYMRPLGDVRDDPEVKRDLYFELSETFDVVEAYEDKPEVGAMYHELGVCVHMVGESDVVG